MLKLLRSPFLGLWALVGVNLILAAAVPWALMAMTPQPAFTVVYSLTSPDLVGALVFVAAELLLLGIWTALYDPRLPVRWVSVIGAIAIGGGVCAGDLNLLLLVFVPNSRFEQRYVAVIAAGVAFVILGFVLVLAVHCVLWLPRAYLGWRLCLQGDRRDVPQRQFGMGQALLWVGLIGALCGVTRAFLGQDWFLPAVLAGALATIVASAVVIPTFWLALRHPVSRWQGYGLVVYVLCLSILEGVAGFWIISVPGVYFMTWACLIVLGFNLFVAGVIWFNAWTLSLLGVRLVFGAKPIASATAAFSVSSIK